MALKYGLIGTGPIGCTIAAHLAKAGAEVVAYSIHPESTRALSSSPITVTGVLNCTGRLAAVHTGIGDFLGSRPDVIIIAVKSCSNKSLALEFKEAGGINGATVVLCQNGMGIEKVFEDAFPEADTLRMVVNMGCKLESPAEVIMSFAQTNYLSMGSGDVSKKIAADLTRAGFPVEISRDPRGEVFKKVALNSCMGAVCAVSGETMGAAMADPELRSITTDLLRECEALAGACGISLPADFIEFAQNYLEMGAGHRPTLAQDLQSGRPSEIEEHNGALIRLAGDCGFEMPMMRVFYRLMRHLDKARLK
jgi:2-dehydropantoate 2-reductase